MKTAIEGNTSPAQGSLADPSSMSQLSRTEKKQLFLRERAERLRDPKVRHMGIDRQALDDQVREKEALRRLERERESYFDRQAFLMDQHAVALQQEVNIIRAEREKNLCEYRQTFQKKETRREWDLNDPQRKAKDLPARVSDDDPRNGPSSLQKFEGEDRDFHKRRAAQQMQQCRWAQQQSDEKLVKKWMEQEANRAFEDRNEETNYRIYQVERNIAEQRRLRDTCTAEFNKKMAEQQRQEKIRAKEEDTRLGLEEIAYLTSCDFLNERQTVVGELGERVKREKYKTMSESQKSKLREEQEEQLQQLRRRRLLEVEETKQWAQQENMQLRMAKALDRQRERELKAERQALAEFQKKQATVAKDRMAKLDQLYTNQVDEDYFKYWDRCM